jgi:solute carrier family 35 (adenosine 3'-phospho 5'-phosphosulfate transporter), member B2
LTDWRRPPTAAFLVLCNRLVAILLAVSLTLANGERFAPVAPLTSYATVALTNFVATYCQYEGEHELLCRGRR